MRVGKSSTPSLGSVFNDKLSQSYAFNQYDREMLRNAYTKHSCISSLIHDINPNQKIVDLGCCNGELLYLLASNLPHLNFTGVDISPDFVLKAKEKTKELKNTAIIEKNVFKLPKSLNNISAFILSSILHEIYSYGDSENSQYSKNLTISFIDSLKNRLSKKGRIIIKDPARPDNPNEKIKFFINKTEGLSIYSYELAKVENVIKLNLRSRYLRFLYEFKPLSLITKLKNDLIQQFEKNTQGTYIAPAWLVSEFLRHRNLCVTDGNWRSEMQELYGVFTKKEIEEIANKLNLKISMLNVYYNKKNHSAIQNNEIIIMDNNEQIIKRENRLPTNIVCVLEKI